VAGESRSNQNPLRDLRRRCRGGAVSTVDISMRGLGREDWAINIILTQGTGGSIASFPKSKWGLLMSERRFRTNPVDAQVGNNVRAKRTELGFSQDHIADQLGLSLAEYQEYESGERRFGPERLLRLARLLGVRPQDFFEDPPSAASTKLFN
jgi:hypothetical protein